MFNVFLGVSEDLIKNIQGVEIGFRVAKAAEIKRHP